MTFDKIIERRLFLLEKESGSLTEINLEVGRPRWTELEVEAVCPIRIRGIMNESLNIFGSDLMNALECGLEFVTSELKNLSNSYIVQWPGGEAYFD